MTYQVVCRDKKKVVLVLTVLFFGYFLLGCAKGGTMTPSPSPRFECSISAKEVFTKDSPIMINFAIRNLSSQQWYFLRWHTPLEGLKNEIFEVIKDGQPLPYRGILMKRGDPSSANEYVRIGSGKTVSASIDLRAGYDFSRTGAYQIKFVSYIFDVASDASQIPRPISSFEEYGEDGEVRSNRIVIRVEDRESVP